MNTNTNTKTVKITLFPPIKKVIPFNNVVINPECTFGMETLAEMTEASCDVSQVHVYTNQHVPIDRLVLRHGSDVVGIVEIKETSSANAG